jgi:hypothetical protein
MSAIETCDCTEPGVCFEVLFHDTERAVALGQIRFVLGTALGHACW